MSFYDDDDDDASGDSRNPLRKTVRDLEKKLAAEKKAREEAEERLTSVNKTVRQRTVSDVLKDKGANPSLARFALQDLDEDPTADAVEKWLTDNGELFGYKAPAPDPADPAQTLGLPAGTTLPPDLVSAYEKFMSTQQGGQSATGGDQLAAKMADPNLTKDELLNLIAQGAQ